MGNATIRHVDDDNGLGESATDDTITLDKKEYTWTDKVRITIDSPDHNLDGNIVETIGDSRESKVKVNVRSMDLDYYKLVETGPNTGIFEGTVTLTGNPHHDADGNGEKGDASGAASSGVDSKETLGPDDGMLPIYNNETGITVSFEFEEDMVAIATAPITWNTGTIKWTESSYSLGTIGEMTVTDTDINLNQEEKDTIVVDVWSDSDAGGLDITLTETGTATGVFKGTVTFTDEKSSGHQLLVTHGDTVWAEYEDNTLPRPHMTSDEIDVTDETTIAN